MANFEYQSFTDMGYTNPILVSPFYAVEKVGTITGYSKLRYEQADVNLGGSYNFTPNLYMTANGGFQWFSDHQPYVYGDEDGTAYSGSMGLGYKF
jgi:hypothetical protein